MFHDSAGSTAVTVPSTAFTSARRVGVTRSGLSIVFVASGSSSNSAVWLPTTRFGNDRTSTASVSGSVCARLTAKSVTVPASSSCTAVADTTGTSPILDVSYDGPVGSTRSTVPRPCRDVSENGWNVVCRHAGPPGSDRIGAITLTSWARQAILTRSAWRSNEISRLPTTTASTTEYWSSMSRGRVPQSRLSSPGNLAWYHTFHSSNDRLTRFLCCPTPRTWSHVAITDSMNRSMFTPLARKLPRSSPCCS